MPISTYQQTWKSTLLFSVAFFACAKFGTLFSVQGTSYVSFWLPAGLYLGVLLLHETRSWAWFILAALPANLLFDLPSGTPLFTTLGFYSANTIEAVTGAWLVRRCVAKTPELTTVNEFLGLLLCSALLSTLLGALVGATVLTASGMSHSYWGSLTTWWSNNAMAIMLVAPFLLVWFSKSAPEDKVFVHGWRILEAVMLTTALTWFTWYMLVEDAGINAPYKSRLMLLLLWAGLRFGLRGVTMANLLFALLVGFFTAHFLKGLSPVEMASGTYVATLQSYLGICVFMVLIPTIVVADRNRKVLEFKQSEEKFAKAFLASSYPMAIAEVETGRYIEVNESFCRLYGFSQEMIIGHTSLELGIWENMEERNQLLEPLRNRGSVRELELHKQLSDGKNKVLLVNAELVELEGKECVVSLLQDITTRRQAEDQLRESEERFLRAFENAPIGMALVGPDGRWLKVNRALCGMVGYSEAELMLSDFQHLTHPDDLDKDLEFVRQVLGGAIPSYQMEKRYFHKNGSIIFIMLSVSLVHDRAGEPLYFISQIENITERKRTEQKVVESLKEKEALLREIHHRVKNNMQVISSILHLQTTYIQDPAALDVFKDCQNRIHTMALIHEKLYRSEGLGQIDFKEYLESLVELLLRSQKNKSVAVRHELQIEPVTLGVDTAIPLGLIANELISNCFKHAFTGRREGWVRVILRKLDQGKFQLVVQDDGRGLPSGFDPGKTTSLGLRLLKILSSQIRGQIEIKSDHGAEFGITFDEAETLSKK